MPLYDTQSQCCFFLFKVNILYYHYCTCCVFGEKSCSKKIKKLPSSGVRAGADSPAPLAPWRWRRLPTGAGTFTPLAADFSRCPPELFTPGTTPIAARVAVDGNPTRAPVNSSPPNAAYMRH